MLKYNLSQIDSLSKKILSFLSKSDCIFLFGELGSGKTTFVRSLIHQLQEKNKIKKTEVTSPTYNLLNEYEIQNLKIMHYDLYRLKNDKEINQLGIFQEDEKVISIIEWPEKIAKRIKDRLEITFYYEDEVESRKIDIKGHGKWKNFKLNAI
jgi:tRNA threonylcarbamoyladenosine biosynthesis protein TsaE